MKTTIKEKRLKGKHLFFWNSYKKDYLKIFLLVVSIIFLFFLVSVVSVESGFWNVSDKIQLNFKWTLQITITGFNLGSSTYLLQRLTKNKLTDPSIMGFGNVNLIPIILLALFTNFQLSDSSNYMSKDTMYYLMPVLVLLTSTLFVCMFHFFSKDKKEQNYNKLIIAGVIFNLIAIAIAFSIKPRLNYLQWPFVEQFIIGFVKSVPNQNILIFSIVVSLICNIWLLLISPKIKICITNQQIATKLGINNNSIMFQVMICVAGLIASSYSLTGDFVFVGLFAANIGFLMFKNKIVSGMLSSGFIGILLVLGTYFVFNNLAEVDLEIIPLMIPILIGPYFLYLLIRMRK